MPCPRDLPGRDNEHGGHRRGRGVQPAASGNSGGVRRIGSDAVELGLHGAHAGGALVGFLLEALPQQAFKARRNPCRDEGPIRLAPDDRRHRVNGGFRGEGRLARQHLVQHAPKRPDIAARVD